MEKLRVQCRVCGKELQGNSGKTYSCGCPNMMTVRGDTVSAVDMSDVIMLNFHTSKQKNDGLPNMIWTGKRQEENVKLESWTLKLDKYFYLNQQPVLYPF